MVGDFSGFSDLWFTRHGRETKAWVNLFRGVFGVWDFGYYREPDGRVVATLVAARLEGPVCGHVCLLLREISKTDETADVSFGGRSTRSARALIN